MTIRLRDSVFCIVLGLVAASVALIAGSSPQASSKTATLAGFQMAVNDYLALRWRVRCDLPPLRPDATLADIFAARERHAFAVRQERGHVRPGNVFNENVAELFRQTISVTLSEYRIDVSDLLPGLKADVPSGAARPQVNDRFPAARGAAVPMVLISALPRLPHELQYRLVDRDLVLVDSDLGLVLDILENALPKDWRAGWGAPVALTPGRSPR